MHVARSLYVALVLAPCASDALAQQVSGAPALEFAIETGSRHGGRYVPGSIGGPHIAVALPVWYRGGQAAVFGLSADFFGMKIGNGDLCYLRPGETGGCRPNFPNLTAFSLGWRSTWSREVNVTAQAAAAYFLGGRAGSRGALLRADIAPRQGHVVPLFFAQYQGLSSFRGAAVTTLVFGVGLQLR